mgnify:CR=1 FL=1
MSYLVSMKKKISRELSDTILTRMDYNFSPTEFHLGMNTELEHQDVTHGNVVKTAKIAAAHLRENPKYYSLLLKHVEKKVSEEMDGAPAGAAPAIPPARSTASGPMSSSLRPVWRDQRAFTAL